MNKIIFATALFTLFPIIPGSAYCADQNETNVSSNPAARAAEIKSWRDQCNDPDYDLRLAYLEQAIATKDVTIQRLCIKAALESDNAEVKNLGLRAALASTDKIFFSASLPVQIEKELSLAGNNEDKVKRVQERWEYRGYQWIKQGFSFFIQSASIANGESEWYPLVKNSVPRDKTTKANIIGNQIRWSGEMDFDNNWDCDLNVELSPGSMLTGKLQCRDMEPYPITAKLL
nr:hypothetical protein [uncultured Desulfobulbus sp.]